MSSINHEDELLDALACTLCCELRDRNYLVGMNGHSVCAECVHLLCAHEMRPKCPECRARLATCRRGNDGFVVNRVLNQVVAVFKRRPLRAQVGPAPVPPPVVASTDAIERSLKRKIELSEEGDSKVEALQQVDELRVRIDQIEQEKTLVEAKNERLRKRWIEACQTLSYMRRDHIDPSWDLIRDVLKGNHHGY